ncbi:baseplate J/gp47 family protein [Bradyrhizobium iriomotense]|uniref:Baseplate assembly protein n=1 Tax=Bradyrhizobium iriomotense TaxID=441950 RepID=A0ABQ6B0L2_9BRAD|nr:baseplate J/gp47 family protein [Bradyrhizobium iriomotense]GLR87959.1 putative baseplate assembly protein [Bradyrhizobium iriomotense]
MTVRFDSEALAARARNLGTLNGMKLLFVTLDVPPSPAFALLDVEFYNANALSPLPAKTDFTLTGGTRLRAGLNPGEVQVTQVSAGATPNVLRLRVEPIGDYSTYTLGITRPEFDPLFASIAFKFRPGCFNLNCAPGSDFSPPPDEPAIDYLARDYDSFRHVLIAAMMQRVPNWQPTSEADLDQVLIDLIAADADELADYQDRVMNEAYFATARKRVSLARYARLMDYHIHEGNQASTWLAVQVLMDHTLPAKIGAWTGDQWRDARAVIFASEADQACFAVLNQLDVYGWDETVSAIEAGSTEADLTTNVAGMSQGEADALRDAFLATDASGAAIVSYILIQQDLNPETGTVNGRDPAARQVMQLLPLGGAVARAESMKDPRPDPVTSADRWFVRVRWLAADALTRCYATQTRCDGQLITGVSRFYGNLLRVTQGRPHVTTFSAPGSILASPDDFSFESKDAAEYEALTRQIGPEQKPWGTALRLTKLPLAFRNTAPGGDEPTRSTLRVTVGGIAGAWDEQSDLIESDGSAQHFVVETDELGVSRIRFGDGINGAALPDDAVVSCEYRLGQGESGNVGADQLLHIDDAAVSAVWNPLDVVDGRSPQPPQEILRAVPEAYRRIQKRAVTLADYAARAEEIPGVARAHAQYAWTGSWRTVRVAIDPLGRTTLDPAFARTITDHLDALRLIGEDLEVRPAQYVPLDIKLTLCADPDYWADDLWAVLENEFSTGFTPDGRPGFFNPDQWTFGQALHASQVIGRALRITGVDRVLSLSMRRWNAGLGGALVTVTLTPDMMPENVVEKIPVAAFEIIEVNNDPSRLETGRIQFDILGGRQ